MSSGPHDVPVHTTKDIMDKLGLPVDPLLIISVLFQLGADEVPFDEGVDLDKPTRDEELLHVECHVGLVEGWVCVEWMRCKETDERHTA